MNQNMNDEERAPKPYEFVPFALSVDRREVAGHHQFDLAGSYSGRLIYRLETLTPLFVGTSSYALGENAGFPREQVIRPFYRVNGVPTVPGSSIKGLLRSIVESVSPSCVTSARVRYELLPRGVELATNRRGCTPERACPACSLFGRMSRLARVSAGDARLLEGDRTELFRLAPLYMPRAFKLPRIYLDGQGKFRGRKFYVHAQPLERPDQPPVEVIPAGQALEGQLDMENLRQAELGLLFFALGLDTGNPLTLKLGGGKPMGLGSVRVSPHQLLLMHSEAYLRAEAQDTAYEGEALIGWIAEAIAEARRTGLILREQAHILAQVLAYRQDRNAPTGVY